MLKSISLENYKCFRDLKNLEIKPLTILCGVNSSGKSSIVDSLLLQKQSYEDNSISNNIKLNGEYVTCGRFRDVAMKHSDEPITISTTYTLTKPKKYNNSTKKYSKYDIIAFKTLDKMYPSFIINSFNITSSISVIHCDHKKNPVYDNTLNTVKITIVANGEMEKSIISSIELRKLPNQLNSYTITLQNFPDGDTGKIVKNVVLHDSICYFENFNLINTFSTDIQPKNISVGGILTNLYLVFKINALQFKNIHYLTPLRGYPKRNYILDRESDDVGLSGEFTPYIMNRFANDYIDGFLPPHNDTIYMASRKYRFHYCVKKWMQYLQFGDYSLIKESETLQLSIQDYNITNVGFGVSQVLPILVSGLIKCDNELLILEQPEIHLHPSAQMCMADFLLSMAINNKGVIVETHSDHIINRVVRRMMEDKRICDIVRIYFVDQDANGVSNVENIDVDPVRGVLTNNKNFFTQFASETEKIIQIAFNNKQKGV